jgi:prohead peptidase. Unknown type peptidase. MEROPS family U09
MKLITEYIQEDLSYFTEATKSGEKNTFIEGIFMQTETKNRNGRMYPKKIMESAVNKYVEEQVSKGRAVGELNHPNGPTINLDKVSHRITDLRFEGNDVIGKALVLNTPMGKIVKGLMEGGVQLGVSSRGMGSIENKNSMNVVKDDFHLATIDIVQDPSAHNAFVNGIMEGVDWVWDNGILKAQQIEKYETEIRRTKAKDLQEMQSKLFHDFLSKL